MHDEVVVQDQATRLREIALRATTTKHSHSPYVIAVVSGKGGVGKSTLALNMALALSDYGKDVLLVDADHNRGNVHVLIGAVPQYALADVLRGDRDIEDVLLHPQPKFHILPGNSGVFNYPSLSERMIKNLCDDVRSLDIPLEFVIFDLSAGLTEDIITFCIEADEVLVVTNEEPTSVMDAYAVIKMVLAKDRDHCFSFVVNGSESPQSADDTARKLQVAVNHFLGRTITKNRNIPLDKNMLLSVREQIPILRLYPSSAASLSILALGRQILQRVKIQTGMENQ